MSGHMIGARDGIDVTRLAMEYNRIPELFEQIQAVTPAILHEAGRVFVKHKVQQNFGLALLHRHQSLDPGCVMVHTENTEQDHICAMTPFDSQPLYAESFFVGSEGKMIPFEYTTEAIRSPTDEFLYDLTAFLNAYGLHQRFGVASISSWEQKLVERQLVDQGTIATPTPDVSEYLSLDGIDTVWAFAPDVSGLKVRVVKRCVTAESGGHKTV